MAKTITKKKPDQPVTHVIFLLDESGSMAPSASDVRGGFNAYVEQIKQDGQTYTLSLVKFANEASVVFFAKPLDQVPSLDTTLYRPSGGTALYDALGLSFTRAREWFGTPQMPYGTPNAKVIFIVMTDGEENSSHSVTKEQATASIKEREAAGNWTFVYMMADADAWTAAQNLGLAYAGNVLSYSRADAGEVFRRAATSTSATSTSCTSASRSFFSSSSLAPSSPSPTEKP